MIAWATMAAAAAMQREAVGLTLMAIAVAILPVLTIRALVLRRILLRLLRSLSASDE